MKHGWTMTQANDKVYGKLIIISGVTQDDHVDIDILLNFLLDNHMYLLVECLIGLNFIVKFFSTEMCSSFL